MKIIKNWYHFKDKEEIQQDIQRAVDNLVEIVEKYGKTITIKIK
jgi:hypothetical protein